MSKLIYGFEELPDFWDDQFRSGSHNGFAEISYEQDGAWFVSAISLECHNGKCGNAAASKAVQVSQAYHGALYHALVFSLEDRLHGSIQDCVNHALTMDGISIPDPNAEHRLRSWELT